MLVLLCLQSQRVPYLVILFTVTREYGREGGKDGEGRRERRGMVKEGGRGEGRKKGGDGGERGRGEYYREGREG